MAVAGWTVRGKGSQLVLDESRKYEGTASLKHRDISKVAYYTNDQTVTDSPTDVAVEWFGYVDDNGSGWDHATQWQATDSYTSISVVRDGSLEAVLKRVDNNNQTDSDSTTIDGGASGWSGVTFSDGGGGKGRWLPLRVEVFIDNNGDLRGRIQEDADSDGTWTDLTDNDLVLTAPGSAVTNGGGVGVGIVGASPDNSNGAWYDATEIYY